MEGGWAGGVGGRGLGHRMNVCTGRSAHEQEGEGNEHQQATPGIGAFHHVCLPLQGRALAHHPTSLPPWPPQLRTQDFLICPASGMCIFLSLPVPLPAASSHSNILILLPLRPSQFTPLPFPGSLSHPPSADSNCRHRTTQISHLAHLTHPPVRVPRQRRQLSHGGVLPNHHLRPNTAAAGPRTCVIQLEA